MYGIVTSEWTARILAHERKLHTLLLGRRIVSFPLSWVVLQKSNVEGRERRLPRKREGRSREERANAPARFRLRRTRRRRRKRGPSKNS